MDGIKWEHTIDVRRFGDTGRRLIESILGNRDVHVWVFRRQCIYNDPDRTLGERAMDAIDWCIVWSAHAFPTMTSDRLKWWKRVNLWAGQRLVILMRRLSKKVTEDQAWSEWDKVHMKPIEVETVEEWWTQMNRFKTDLKPFLNRRLSDHVEDCPQAFACLDACIRGLNRATAEAVTYLKIASENKKSTPYDSKLSVTISNTNTRDREISRPSSSSHRDEKDEEERRRSRSQERRDEASPSSSPPTLPPHDYFGWPVKHQTRTLTDAADEGKEEKKRDRYDDRDSGSRKPHIPRTILTRMQKLSSSSSSSSSYPTENHHHGTRDRVRHRSPSRDRGPRLVVKRHRYDDDDRARSPPFRGRPAEEPRPRVY